MPGKMKTRILSFLGGLCLLSVSCNKVSPVRVLVAGTAVEDRVKMSHLFFRVICKVPCIV